MKIFKVREQGEKRERGREALTSVIPVGGKERKRGTSR